VVSSEAQMTTEERARRLLRGARLAHIRDTSDWWPVTCLVCGAAVTDSETGYFVDSPKGLADALIQWADLVACR
jgi:hypothetical protein